VGDGVAGLTSAAHPVFLDELDKGTLLQSVPLPMTPARGCAQCRAKTGGFAAPPAAAAPL